MTIHSAQSQTTLSLYQAKKIYIETNYMSIESKALPEEL